MKNPKKALSFIPIAISIIALILSQLEPLYKAFEKPEISIIFPNQIGLRHAFGNIIIDQYIQIRNTGNRTGEIKKIVYLLQKKDDPQFLKVLPIQIYYLKPETLQQGQTVTQIPFGTILLKPQEIWEYYASSYKLFSKNEEAQLARFRLDVINEINTKLGFRSQNDNSLIPIDLSLYAKIKEFSDKKSFGLTKGDYYLDILIWQQNDDIPSIRKLYSFSIYETDMVQFLKISEDYQYGLGIYSQNLMSNGFMANLTTMNDKNLENKIFEAARNFIQ